MNTHEKISEMLIGFVLGELPKQAEREVKAHAAECQQCSSELKRLQALLKCTEQMRGLSADNNLCKSAKDSLLAAIAGENKQPAPSRNISAASFWRSTLRNRITKLVAAAVIIIAAGIGIAVFSNLDYGSGRTIVENPTEGPKAELTAELDQVHKMFAAHDIRGLEAMLLNAKFDQSKVLAANYLAEIGDSNSIAVLQQVNDEYGGTEAAFAAAIAAIEANITEVAMDGPEGGYLPEVNDIAVAEGNAPVEVTADDLLKLVPAESMFCVRMNNFDYVLGMIDQYLAGISPIPMGATMGARMQLVGALGDPALNGVNTAGNFALFGLASPPGPNESPLGNLFIAGLVPLADYEKFVSDNPNCEQPDANGISVIKTGGALNPDKKMLATKLGGYALISSVNNYDKLRSIVKSISQGSPTLATSLDAGEVAAATTQPLWAYGNVQRAAKVFGPMVYAELEQGKQQLETMNAGPQGGPAPAEVMNIYFGMLDILTEEVKSVSISINPKADVLNLTVGVAAVPQTYLAKMFVADTSGGANTLLRYLEDGAFLNLGFKTNTPFIEELTLTNYDFIAFLSDQDIPDETIDKLEKLVADMMSCTAGPGVMSFVYNSEGWPPFAGKYIIAVKDEERWNQVLEAGFDLWNTGEFAGLQSKMGMEYRYEIKAGADDYNGVSIDVGKFVMEANEPNSMYGKMIDQMYHGGFDFRYATVNGLWLCVFGADCNSTIRELIDQVKAGGPKETASEMALALEVLTEADKAEFVGTVNFIRYLNLVAGMLRGVQVGPMGQQILPVDVETNSNIPFAGTVANGRIAVEIALPKQHILEAKAGLETMRQQMTAIMALQTAISQLPLTEGPEPNMLTDYALVRDANTSDEELAIKGLRTFARISGGRYPSSLDLMTTMKEAGEALRKSILEDPDRDPNTPLTTEEVMPKLVEIQATSLFYAKLVRDANDVTYCGTVTTEFPHAILMYWKISEDKYRVIFADLTVEDASAERLAELEATPLNLSPKAIKPDPADGRMARTVTDLELSWMPGFNAAEHRIYLGTNPDELSLLGGLTSPLTKPQPQDGAVAVPVVEVELSSMPGFNAAEHRIYLGTSPETSHFITDRVLYVTSGKLQVDTIYYWRVDEVQTDGSIVVGDVWSFNTGKLIGWWKFDETSGIVAADSSGNGYDGSVMKGAPIWDPDGRFGGCLNFDETYGVSIPGSVFGSHVDSEITISVWVNGNADQTNCTNVILQAGCGCSGRPYIVSVYTDWQDNGLVVLKTGRDEPDGLSYNAALEQWAGRWNHYAFVKNAREGFQKIYLNGELVPRYPAPAHQWLESTRPELV